jgi:protein-tyrosine-phosphatase
MVRIRYTEGMHIQVICHGNGLRSILAEAYLKSLKLPNVEVQSSGTDADLYIRRGQPVSVHALALLEAHGMSEYAKHHRDQLTSGMIRADDVVICVSPQVYTECRQLVSLPERTVVWRIADIGEPGRLVTPDRSLQQLTTDMFAEIKICVNDLISNLRN